MINVGKKKSYKVLTESQKLTLREMVRLFVKDMGEDVKLIGTKGKKWSHFFGIQPEGRNK